MTGRLNVFHRRFYTNPRSQARVLPVRSEMVTTFDRADVRFARPNIQICDAHVVDGISLCEGCRNKGKTQLISALDRISERITLAFQSLSRPRSNPGSTIEKQKVIF
jgi:hypothetical protein